MVPVQLVQNILILLLMATIVLLIHAVLRSNYYQAEAVKIVKPLRARKEMAKLVHLTLAIKENSTSGSSSLFLKSSSLMEPALTVSHSIKLLKIRKAASSESAEKENTYNTMAIAGLAKTIKERNKVAKHVIRMSVLKTKN